MLGGLLAGTSRSELLMIVMVCGRRVTLLVTILLVTMTDMIRVLLVMVLLVLMLVMMLVVIMMMVMMGLKIMMVVMLVFGLRSNLGLVVVVKRLFNMRWGWSLVLLTVRSTRPDARRSANGNHVSNHRLVFPLYKVLDQRGEWCSLNGGRRSF